MVIIVRAVTSRVSKTTDSLENEGYCETLMALEGNERKQMLSLGHKQKGRMEAYIFQA